MQVWNLQFEIRQTCIQNSKAGNIFIDNFASAAQH